MVHLYLESSEDTDFTDEKVSVNITPAQRVGSHLVLKVEFTSEWHTPGCFSL